MSEDRAPKDRIVHGKTIGLALCEALGLNPMAVRSLVIKVPVDDVATIDVERMVTAADVPFLVQVIEKYRLAAPDDETEVDA